MWDPQHLTILQASTACHGVSFTFLYVEDVRTSQEEHILTVMGIALVFNLNRLNWKVAGSRPDDENDFYQVT
jgi:hypothetical protein